MSTPSALAPATGLAVVPTAAVVGNPRRGSRTLAVAHASIGLIRSGLAGCGVPTAEPDVLDLAELTPTLSQHLVAGEDRDGRIAAAQARIRIPGLLFVVSPTFNGSYTGLLKMFIDLLPRQALAGTVAVPLMTAAYAGHRFVADTYLRALLLELGATVPVSGLSVIEREFAQLEDAIDHWSQTRLPVLAAVLHHTPQVRRSAPSGPVLESGPDHGPLTMSHAQEGSS
jgi:FMN reductase